MFTPCIDVDEDEEENDQIVSLGYPSGFQTEGDCTVSRIAGGCPEDVVHPRCPHCHEMMLLVAQIYAPVDEINHRHLLIFGCNFPTCHLLTSWVVIRVETPIIQQQVVVSPPPTSKSIFDTSLWVQGSNNDLEDLLNLRDLNLSKKSKKKKKNKITSRALTVDLEVDGEPLPTVDVNGIAHVDALMRRYREQELESAEIVPGGGKEDEEKGSHAQYFQSRMERMPEQCLRYAYNGFPLWPCEPFDFKVPPCSCGLNRVFESQLVPGILWQLEFKCKLEIFMDWSSVFIYSCPASCNSSCTEYALAISPIK